LAWADLLLGDPALSEEADRASSDVYCTLAIAEAHSGRLEESRRILDKARRMGPDSGLLALAQRVIDAIN
jgi:hypothetical protein